MDEKTQQKISQLQMIEHGLNNFLAQKQQFQTQLLELDSALEEVVKVDTAYKIVGNIMILSQKDDLTKSLTEKKQIVELRIKSIEKQEKTMRDKAEGLQKEVMSAIKK